MSTSHLLLRSHLLNRMVSALRTGHLLLEAPGGYGKTVLLEALAAQRPASFYHALTPTDVDLAALQAQLDSPLRQADTTLILDDVHLLNADSEVLAWLYDHLLQPLNRHARLVLAGRHLDQPNLTLLVAKRHLTQFTLADLAFSRAECQVLGIPIVWWERTEGWPLALAMVQQLTAQQVTPFNPVAVDGSIFDALAHTLFVDLPPDLRRFVEVSAVPLRFSPALVAHLLEATEEQVAGWLDAVRRRALFVQATDPPGWLRYHDVVREFLLRQHDATPYWGRAVSWFEAQDDLPMAIEHALAGNLHREAARLLELIAPTFVYDTGRYRTFRRWVLSLDPTHQAAHPLLLLQLGKDLQELGLRTEAQQLFDAAQRYASNLDVETQAKVGLGLANQYVVDGAAERARPLLEHLLANPALPGQLRRTAYKTLGGVHYYLSQLHAAKRAYLNALAIDAETPESTSVKIRQNLANVALIPLGAFAEAQAQLAYNEPEVKPHLVAYIWHLLAVGWLNEAMGDWLALGQTLAELRRCNLQTEAADEEDSAELMLHAIYHIGVGDWAAATASLDRIAALGTENPDIALYTALCRAWLLRRRGLFQDAVIITEQALAQPWDVPLTRSMVALEGELARFALGSTTHEFHPDVRHIVRVRARHWLLRLHALAALRCYRAGDARWRRHVQAVLRQTHRPGYDRLLVARDPELGAHFWSLCIATDSAPAQAIRALREIGQIEPTLALLSHADHVVRERAAWALAAVGAERAIPALVASAQDNAPAVWERALEQLEQTPPPPLQIKLMGQFAVTRAGASLTTEAWTRPAARRLFQYFALHTGRPLLRDKLLDDLWPDADPATARNSLKTTLSWMRKAIEPYLRPKSAARYYSVEHEVYTFGGGSTSSAILIDAVEFTRTVSVVLRSPAEHDPTLVGDALLAALRNWEPLLPDLQGEDWTLAARERLLDLYVRGCSYVANAFLARSRWEDAAYWTSQLLAVAPWSEEGYQILMRAQARQGNRSQALHTYSVAVAALAREFDAPPSKLTDWLATRLRRGEEI